MKIYVASSFKLVEKVKSAVEALEEAGHEITVKWWARMFDIPGERDQVQTTDLKERYESLSQDEFYERKETFVSFASDYWGVKEADVFLIVADSTPRKFNGANVELGIAISDRKPCFSIGELETSVLYYPVIRCSDIDEVIQILGEGIEGVRDHGWCY